MTKQVTIETLREHLVCDNPLDAPFDELIQHLLEHSKSSQNRPESHYQIDPRDGTISIFSEARAKRVHTVRSEDATTVSETNNCPICNGQLTSVCDIQPLSEGASFITDNLYPVVTPHGLTPAIQEQYGSHSFVRGGNIFGGHFLQWTSTIHENDWHNMPLDDLILTIYQLSKFEAKLLLQSDNMPKAAGSRDGARGYVSIFKNFGAKAGASLSHGHQQILFSNLMSRSSFNNWRFYGRHMENFSDYMLRENPSYLTVKDYGDVILVVPYFMHRPYTMMAFVKQTDLSYLFQLPEQTLHHLTQAMQDAISALRAELSADGKTASFNFTIHTGPGCGLYVELLSRADTFGGLELQGTWVCQALPDQCASRLRERIEKKEK